MSSAFDPVKMEGSLDAVRDGAVHGWAWDPRRPTVRVALEILLDDKYVATVVADGLREDLKTAGKGDGYCCFHFELPDEAFDGRPHTVAVCFAGSTVSIGGSPVTGTFDGSARKKDVPDASLELHPRLVYRTKPERALSGEEVERFQKAAASDATFDGIAVIIPTYNRGEALETTLRAWMACDRPCKVEFIVVDDGSSDDTPDRLARLQTELPELKWTRQNNGGPARARNTGAMMTALPLLLFTGDDIRPATSQVLHHHLRAHQCFPALSAAMLGKITWPDVKSERLNFVMSHIQGVGQQQFGFFHLVPYTWLDWRFFYTSNVSLKRAVVANWHEDGFSSEFPLASFEDAELAYRLSKRLEGGFRILYNPAAVVTHHHAYTVKQFLQRQFSAGLMAKLLDERHPETAAMIGTSGLKNALESPGESPAQLVADYQSMLEGVKSWAAVVEQNHHLGSQNWHADLLAGVFLISYLQGRIMAHDKPDSNYAAGYKYIAGMLEEQLSTAASFEAFGKLLSLTAV